MEMRRLFRIWILLCLSIIGVQLSATAKTNDSYNEVVEVPKYSTVRSTVLHLKIGDSIIVTAQSTDQQFGVDLYVYSAAQELFGKDDEESSTQAFSWSTPVEGDFYVLARHLGSGSGFITIVVARSKGDVPTKEAEYAIRKIFFATDRNVVPGSEVDFGREPDLSGRLHLGTCSVSIPRDHRMGELEGPSIFRLEFRTDPSKHIALLSVNEEEGASFYRQIAGALSHSRRKELFVFIHGFNTTFADAARRTAQIAYDLGFDGPAILYSWPSQGSVSPIAYNMDSRNAQLTIPILQQFLLNLVADSGASTIHLIAHSMGSRPLTEAIKAMAAASQPGRSPFINQLVLLAPDIDSSLFTKQLAPSIRGTAARITLYASSRDQALITSEAYAGYSRAGEAGSHLVVTPGVDTIDASKVDTSALGFFHQYYADSSTILSDLFQLLHNTSPDDRFGLQRQRYIKSSDIYWEFKASR